LSSEHSLELLVRSCAIVGALVGDSSNYQLFEKLNSTGELRQLLSVETLYRRRQHSHSSSAPGSENPPAFRSGLDLRQPTVAWVSSAADETFLLEAGDDPRHRGRLHSLRGCQLTQGYGAAEDDDRECGQSRSRKPAGVVFLAQLPEEMDRSGMEPVGERGRLAFRRSIPQRSVRAHATGTSLIRLTTLPWPSEKELIQISRPFMREMTRGSSMLLAPADLISP
jgi:hypothetical protein